MRPGRWSRPFACVVALAVALAAAATLAAQGPPQAYKLYLKPQPGLPSGKAIVIEGDTRPDGDRFFVEDLSILQPVAVTLLTKNAEDDITLTLLKDRWDEKPSRTASTKGTGQSTLKFRTMGEVKIVVAKSGESKRYHLIVWAGDAVEPEVPPAFIPMKEYLANPNPVPQPASAPGAPRAPAGGPAPTQSLPVLWIIAGALGLIVLLLVVLIVVMLTRKRGQS